MTNLWPHWYGCHVTDDLYDKWFYFLFLNRYQFYFSKYSYHQKYLLRQNQGILRALKLSDKELIKSTVATRLNGYCGGYGKLSDLEKEIDSFKLDAKTEEDIRRIVSRGTHH